jgi:hypothetical protein
MDRFLKKIGIFLALFLAVSLLAQVLLGWLIRDRTINGQDNLDVVRGQENGMIFLGSSRCYAQFDPVLFSQNLKLKCLNLGSDGHSELTMHILRLLNYLEKNKAPKFVLLNFDPLVSGGSMDENTNFVNKDDFARFAYRPSADNLPIVDYFHFNFAEKYIPLYALLRYKEILYCLPPWNRSAWAMHGYDRHDELWDTISHPVNHLLKKFYFGTDDIPSIKERLIQIDSICKSHSITLICVQTPIYQEVYDRKSFSYPGMICQDLHIPFIDLNKNEIDGDINYFYNEDHLNTQGVIKMAGQLFGDSTFLRFFSPS